MSICQGKIINIMKAEDDGKGRYAAMRFRIEEILKEKGKTKYWLYIQLGLSYQNFNRLVTNQTKAIKLDNLRALCDILECTPNDLFEEYHKTEREN